MDPWYDYLALPVVPLLLGAQLWAASVWPRRKRLPASAAVTVLVAVLFVVVLSAVPEDDPNIGGGILMFELAASLGITAWSLRRDERPA